MARLLSNVLVSNLPEGGFLRQLAVRYRPYNERALIRKNQPMLYQQDHHGRVSNYEARSGQLSRRKSAYRIYSWKWWDHLRVFLCNRLLPMWYLLIYFECNCHFIFFLRERGLIELFLPARTEIQTCLSPDYFGLQSNCTEEDFSFATKLMLGLYAKSIILIVDRKCEMHSVKHQ